MPDRVLVVDDDPAAREIIARLLEEGSFAVVTAASGSEAIELLADDDANFGAVLTDVSMPDMTGVELAYWVRDHHPSLPVAIISGDISDLERSVVARAGVPFLKKPVRAEALHTAVREAIRQATRVAP
jgi:CheY-like chemotaxis protein